MGPRYDPQVIVKIVWRFCEGVDFDCVMCIDRYLCLYYWAPKFTLVNKDGEILYHTRQRKTTVSTKSTQLNDVA